MKLNQKRKDDFKEIFHRNESANLIENSESLNYLYPMGHRVTHQMRWFKGSRNRGFRSDIAA